MLAKVHGSVADTIAQRTVCIKPSSLLSRPLGFCAPEADMPTLLAAEVTAGVAVFDGHKWSSV